MLYCQRNRDGVRGGAGREGGGSRLLRTGLREHTQSEEAMVLQCCSLPLASVQAQRDIIRTNSARKKKKKERFALLGLIS